MKNPDDRCGVCDTTRENHGDKHHKFTLGNELIPIEPGAAPRKQPPTPRGEALKRDPVANLVMRLIENLTKRGLLEGEDLVEIMGGPSADHRGEAGSGVAPAEPTESPGGGGWANPQ